MAAFKDLFSKQSDLYARYRPGYPDELFLNLRKLVPGAGWAWDCATGNGQAAAGLARHFERVIASDASARQLANAQRLPNVIYARFGAEQTPIARHSIDLVTVAQAAHWFELEQFYGEVRRVLKPGGVLALWCYGVFKISPEVDPVIDRFYREITGPYWAPGRQWIDEEYKTLPFPFAEEPFPEVQMELDWELEGVVGILMSWSASQKFTDEKGYHPLTLIESDLTKAWGDPHKKRTVRWPLSFRVGRV